MMEDTIDARFTEGYDEAKQFWDDEDLDGCIEKARALLNEPAIPRYHPIKTLILLGSSLGDWQEAEDCRVRADALWRVVRRWHSEGEDAEIDVAVTELRDALNALTTALKEDQPKPYDPNCDPEANVQDLIEAEVDEAKAHQQAEEEDPEELERNDNAVLAAQEQMSKMTAESTEVSMFSPLAFLTMFAHFLS